MWRVLFAPQCQLRRVFQASSEAYEIPNCSVSQVVLPSGNTFLEMLANKSQN